MESKKLHLAPMESGRCTSSEKPDLTCDYLAHCAYCFAYSLLWDEETFSALQKRESLRLLKNYFQQCKNRRQGLLILCERVQLEYQSRSLPVMRSFNAMNPPVWFSEILTLDGAALHEWWRRVIQKRTRNFMFRKEEAVLALQYLAYVCNPTAATFHRCRKRLLARSTYAALYLFNQSVLLYNYPF